MADFEIDWAKIGSITDFEEMVATLIFLSDLHSVDFIKLIPRSDLFWTTWHNGHDRAYRVIFEGPGRNAEQRQSSLKQKFDEKIAPVWRQSKADTKVVLFLNFDDPPTDWAKYHERLEIIRASDIAETIEKEQWWPIFRKYFEGGMRPEDAEKCEFLQPFVESLVPAVEGLTAKETLNVISWVKHVAFYRPKEGLAFCQALYDSKKSTQNEKHPIFGTITIGRKNYLDKLSDVLHPIAAHLEYFEGALELLLRISSEVDTFPHPMRGSLSQSVEKMTSYYYGRDFSVRDNRAYYNTDYNQKTLDVIARLLREQDNKSLVLKCLAVLPKLLEMKVSTSEWSGDRSAVRWREFRLPVADEGLKAIRQGALNLIFSTFEGSTDSELKHKCLVTLQDAFHRMSLSAELQDDFAVTLRFLNRHVTGGDPVVLNDVLELLSVLSHVNQETIRSEATALQNRLQDNFELQLYHLLFGKKGWDPSSDDLQNAVKRANELWANDPRQMLLLIDGFHRTTDTHPTGLRSFLQALGYHQAEFATRTVSLISSDPSFRASLSPRFIQSLGYLLCGIRLSDPAASRSSIDALLTTPDDNATIIVLTSLHLFEYDRFTADDLTLVERLISGADENIRILAADTLWYFGSYQDFTAVLRIYQQLAHGLNERLAEVILRGIAQDLREENFSDKWADPDRRAILKEILSSVTHFPRLNWDSMASYYLELLLRELWNCSTEDLLDFFKLRLDSDRLEDEGYDPLPYDLNTLFQGVSAEKQNEFVSRVLSWNLEHYSIYWIARLIGLACSKNVQPSTVETLRKIIRNPKKHQLLMISKLMDEIPLGDTFYDLAMRIVKKGYGRKEIRNQLFCAFISTTGGSRIPGQPFPSHVHHLELIKKYKALNTRSAKSQKFLRQWEEEINALMRRDEIEDSER